MADDIKSEINQAVSENLPPDYVNRVAQEIRPVQAPTPEPIPGNEPISEVNVWTPDGDIGVIPSTHLNAALDQGYKLATPEEVQKYDAAKAREAEFGTTSQQVLAGAEAFGRGAAGPIFTAAERMLGASPERIYGRKEEFKKEHPIAAPLTEAAGFVAPAIASFGGSALARLGVEAAAEAVPAVSALSRFTQAGMVEKAGEIGAKLAAKFPGITAEEGTGIAARMLTGGARGFAEMAAFTAGDELSNRLMNDPEQTAGTVAANIGLSSILGGIGGAAFSAVSPAWKKLAGDKLAKIGEDFKGRIKEYFDNPEPVKAVTEELLNHHSAIKEMADEVYGATGIKSEAISRLVPEMNEKIQQHSENIVRKLEDAVSKMEANPADYPESLVNKLRKRVDELKDATSPIRNPLTNQPIKEPNSVEIFNALQDTKRQLQEWGKFHKDFVPLAEVDFRNAAKGLSHELRVALEDPAIWGKAGKVQQDINKAFSEYLPTLKDFEKRFTTLVNGERVVDPGKVNTYLNQLGKPTAEIKQEQLKNFLDASEKYRETIHKVVSDVGLSNPMRNTPTNLARDTLKEKTTGAKLADIFIQKALLEGGGAGLGAVSGELAGRHFGIPYLGALIGEHALGPFFKSVLPVIANAVLSKTVTGEGIKAAAEYGTAAAAAEKETIKAVKNVFKAGSRSVSEILYPNDKDRNRISKLIAESQDDPNKFAEKLAGDGHLNYYLPGHAVAMSALAAGAVQYLNSIKPNPTPKNPLDQKVKPNAIAEANYKNALNIAAKPNLILEKIRRGNLTPQDITHFKNIYPGYYRNLQQKMMNEIIETKNKGINIPYSIRLSASMFLGQALDSTMTQQGILAAQTMKGAASQGQQPQQMPPAKRSMSGISKMPTQFQTPGQAREAERSKGK